MAFGSAVDVPADASAAAWIAPRLGPFGTVGGLVPGGYQRYLLVDYRRTDGPLGWDGVQLLSEQLARLLVAHTTTPELCWFSVWEGYGFESSTRLAAVAPLDDEDREEIERERRRLRDEDARRSEAVRAALAVSPAFELPNRRYYLLRGPVTAASRLERPDGPFPQPPDLWWPDDHDWFVGGDTDLDWCYVAGSEAVVSSLAAELRWPTRSVAWDAANAAVGG
jgi:hypothetical protein